MVDLNNIQQFTTDKPVFPNLLWTEDEYAAMPHTHKAQIFFLDSAATKYIYSFTGDNANLITGDVWDPFAKGNFKHTETFTEFTDLPESRKSLEKWLFNRGIKFDTPIFVLPNGFKPAFLMTWKMLIKNADSLFRMTDVMVFDRSQNWCLFFYHEKKLFFGKEPSYDPAENDEMMKKLNERKQEHSNFKHPYL